MSGCVARDESVDERAEHERWHEADQHADDRQSTHGEHAAAQRPQKRERPPPGDGGEIAVALCGWMRGTGHARAGESGCSLRRH
jgi:hypothetical protein